MSNIESKTLNEQILEEIQEKKQSDNLSKETEINVDLKDARITELELQLIELKKKEHTEYDNLLRAKAEVENIRRRTELDIQKIHKFALESFSSDLLPVIDNLERALELTNKNNPELIPMIKGIELTLKSLQDVIYKYGIIIINDINVPFNPDIHQAISLSESNDHQPNHVIMIMQKGYMLNGRLLRPAMVIVSKVKT
ncbi:Protein GrpE [Serratia symbiotica]|nr:Protein GrpE [Serratia symbiotica]